jgi:hypothetical protein
LLFNTALELALVVVAAGATPLPVVVPVLFVPDPVAAAPLIPVNAPLEASVSTFAPAVATNGAAEIVLVKAGNNVIVKRGGSNTVNAFPALLDSGNVPG